MSVWTLHLPYDAISWRSMNSRDHWSKRRADVEATHLYVNNHLKHVTAPPPEPPVRISVTMWAKDRRLRDADNALASAKPAIDAIVGAGVIEDDNWKFAPVWQVQIKCRPDDPGWTIRLEELR